MYFKKVIGEIKIRDKRHVDKRIYTLIDGLFYEPFRQMYSPNKKFVHTIKKLVKGLNQNWTIEREGMWFYAMPEGIKLSLQGWKIHVSATFENAEEILQKVSPILLGNRVGFKFLLDTNIIKIINNKNWDRGGSGKFITIYPQNKNEFRLLTEELFKELKLYNGPYILSDKRYKDCKVLYFRYGGIKRNVMLSITGEKIPVLVSPDNELIEDARTPYFNPPSWAKNPFAEKESEKDSSEEIVLNKDRYLIKEALSFSNSGGVYLAEDRKSRQEVIIKEARPYTILDDEGKDAVSLLKKEYEILRFLEGTDIAPKPIEFFHEWEHTYLVEEYLKGLNIREIILKKNPLTKVNPCLKDTKEYYDTFVKLFVSFTNVLRTLHKKGIVFGDLSAQNLIINNDTYSLKLLDFEGAFRVGIEKPTRLFTLGFRDARRVFKSIQDFKDDIYSMGLVMSYFLFPTNSFFLLRDDYHDNVLKIFLDDLGWPKMVFNIVKCCLQRNADYSYIIDSLKRQVRLKKPKYAEDIKKNEVKEIIKKFGAFISNHLEYNKENRLFPADPFMYKTNLLSIGFGATGVMYALKNSGFSIPKRAFHWIEKKLKDVNELTYPPGFLTGTSGIAWTLWDLGYQAKALECMHISNNHRLLKSHHSLFYGSAGIGMANLYFYLKTNNEKYLDAAIDLGKFLLHSAQENDKGIYWEDKGKTYIGYGYGQSGVSLFLLRLYQLMGEKQFLAYGERALKFDLSHGFEMEEGVLSFPASADDNTTYEPYIEAGSGGIAKVLLRYGMSDKTEKIINDVNRKYAVFSGLSFGLASFIDVLTDAYVFSAEKKYLTMAKRPLTGIKQLYLLKTKKRYAVPGDNLYRISCDYATGVAGVMRTLYRYINLDAADFTLDEVTK